MRRRYSLLCSLVTAVLMTVTHASKAPAFEIDATRFSVSGFGTLGFMTVDKPKVRYKVYNIQGGGVDNGFNAEFGSNFGLQGTVRLLPQISVTAQVVAQRKSETFEPVAEWLFVKWQPSDELSFRAGRLAAPVYSVSDHRLVNYANVWVRPPVDLYSQIAFTHFHGFDVLYRYNTGYGTIGTQVYFGETNEQDGTYKTGVQLETLTGANLFYEFGPVKLRGGYLETEMTLKPNPVAPLVGALRQAAAFPGLGSLTNLANDFDFKNKTVRFLSVAANVDYKNALLMWELGHLHFDGILPESLSWALTAGYRFGDFTPYAMYSQISMDEAKSPIPATVPALAPLRAGIDISRKKAGTRTIGAGIRWDVWENIALKFQFDHTKGVNRIANGQFGTVFNTPAGFKDAVNVFSLSVDFVF